MNKVTVTRKSHSATFRQCKNLGQLIAALEVEGEKKQQYISRIQLNDRFMDEDEEKLLDNLSINEIETLTIEYASIGELVSKSIVDIIACIQETQLIAIKFSKEFRAASCLDQEKIKYVLIQCRSIIDALEEVFSAHVSQKFHIKHHSLWLESEKELTNILQCILQSRKMSDAEFVSDLIEYDLVQALDQWEEVLEKELIDNPVLNGIFRLKRGPSHSDNGVDA